MTTFNPANLSLTDIYTDSKGVSKTTNVLGNGQMQAMVFPTARYTYTEDSISDSVKQQIKKYIADNTNVYVITETGAREKLSWTKSTSSNEFLHDIYTSNAADEAAFIPKKTEVFTAPIYYLVPKGSVGKFTWIAELDNKYTMEGTAVTVTCHRLSLMPENFEIVDLDAKNDAALRIMRYNPIGSLANTSLKLTKCFEYKGLLFSGGNCWVSMAQTRPLSQLVCFVKYNETSPKIGILGKKYGTDEFQKSDDVNTTLTTLVPSLIQEATTDPYKDAESFAVDWSSGIPMILLKESVITANDSNVPFIMDSFHMDLQDNYGNVVSVKLDLNHGGFYQWSVNDVYVK